MDSIIFDLDGTLWDSRKEIAIAWNQVIKEYDELDEITVDDLTGMMGLQLDEIGRKLFPTLSEEQRKEVLQKCIEVENQYIEENGGQPYRKLEEVLDALSKQYKLYIVSNCQEGYIEAFSKYHNLGHYFLDFENPGRTGLTKGEKF
ncbi:hypothetical protein GCM10008967_29690 [Bacillus carboniphilus]|uniref:HAD family hydrolase n=1 Tax=Bacillus carboniphilus TaxID=86663 RepID=A0ABP3G6B3_9BACI